MNKARKFGIAGILGAALAAGIFTHVDAYPNIDTFGVSVGTDSHYCSVDHVSHRLEWSCENAGDVTSKIVKVSENLDAGVYIDGRYIPS